MQYMIFFYNIYSITLSILLSKIEYDLLTEQETNNILSTFAFYSQNLLNNNSLIFRIYLYNTLSWFIHMTS